MAAYEPDTQTLIKEAARKLFTQNGYAATSIRDIASEAGTNVALISYYFRGKDNLFKSIMLEFIAGFLRGIAEAVNNEETSLEEKIQILCDAYISALLQQPDVPLFVLSELRSNPQMIFEQTGYKSILMNSVLFQQFAEAAKKTPYAELNPAHLFISLFGMIVFPFLARPVLSSITGMDDSTYNAFLQERRELIPQFMQAILGKGA